MVLGPFIDAGIPAGGLFTGAEDIKTEEEEEIYGGVAGLAYDPCYHAACDTLKEEDQPEEVQRIEEAYLQQLGEDVVEGNINTRALDEMSDGVAHATLVFAQTTSAVGGTEKGTGTPPPSRSTRGRWRSAKAYPLGHLVASGGGVRAAPKLTRVESPPFEIDLP